MARWGNNSDVNLLYQKLIYTVQLVQLLNDDELMMVYFKLMMVKFTIISQGNIISVNWLLCYRFFNMSNQGRPTMNPVQYLSLYITTRKQMNLYIYSAEHRIILSKDTSLHRVYICELHSTLVHVLALVHSRCAVGQGLRRGSKIKKIFFQNSILK